MAPAMSSMTQNSSLLIVFIVVSIIDCCFGSDIFECTIYYSKCTIYLTVSHFFSSAHLCIAKQKTYKITKKLEMHDDETEKKRIGLIFLYFRNMCGRRSYIIV